MDIVYFLTFTFITLAIINLLIFFIVHLPPHPLYRWLIQLFTKGDKAGIAFNIYTQTPIAHMPIIVKNLQNKIVHITLTDNWGVFKIPQNILTSLHGPLYISSPSLLASTPTFNLKTLGANFINPITNPIHKLDIPFSIGLTTKPIFKIIHYLYDLSWIAAIIAAIVIADLPYKLSTDIAMVLITLLIYIVLYAAVRFWARYNSPPALSVKIPVNVSQSLKIAVKNMTGDTILWFNTIPSKAEYTAVVDRSPYMLYIPTLNKTLPIKYKDKGHLRFITNQISAADL